MSNIRLFIFLSTLLLSFSSFLPAKAQEKIDALLIIDSRNNLNRSVSHDEKIITDLLQTIATSAHMELKITTYKGAHVLLRNIHTWIASLKKTSHDVVFFYFSGHGTGSRSSQIPWPSLFLSTKNMLVPMKGIIESIETTKTRLSIILTDCCNGHLYKKSVFSLLQSKKATPRATKKEIIGAYPLFRQVSGHIRATASIPGQNAQAYTYGSVFTLALQDALGQALRSPAPTWEDILGTTKKLCGKLQTPYFTLELETVDK